MSDLGGTTLSVLRRGEIFRSPMISIASNRITGANWAHRFGINKGVGTSLESIWSQGGLYPFLDEDSAEAMSVASTSTDDDAGGTGALTVYVEYLDSNYATTEEVVTLDGQTEVALSNNVQHVQRAWVVTTGSGRVNAGDIYIGNGTFTNGVPANVYGKIEAGEGQTTMGGVTVIPVGETWYPLNFDIYAARSATANIDVQWYIRKYNESWRILNVFPIYQNSVRKERSIPQTLPAKTIIDFRAKTSAGTLPVSVNIEYLSLNDNFYWQN